MRVSATCVSDWRPAATERPRTSPSSSITSMPSLSLQATVSSHLPSHTTLTGRWDTYVNSLKRMETALNAPALATATNGTVCSLATSDNVTSAPVTVLSPHHHPLSLPYLSERRAETWRERLGRLNSTAEADSSHARHDRRRHVRLWSHREIDTTVVSGLTFFTMVLAQVTDS